MIVNLKAPEKGFFTKERFGNFQGTYTTYPWAASCSGYTKKDGMIIPMKGEVRRYLPDGHWKFIDCTLETIEYWN